MLPKPDMSDCLKGCLACLIHCIQTITWLCKNLKESSSMQMPKICFIPVRENLLRFLPFLLVAVANFSRLWAHHFHRYKTYQHILSLRFPAILQSHPGRNKKLFKIKWSHDRPWGITTSNIVFKNSAIIHFTEMFTLILNVHVCYV